MARFRPSRLFRRLSSRGSQDTAASSSPPATTTTPSDANAPPTPKLAAYSLSTPSPKRLRKSTSLPKLRKKFNTQSSPLEVPESVEEKRESVLLPEFQADTKDVEDRRESEQRTIAKPAEELSLDKGEIEVLRENPTLVVEEPTPDIVDELNLQEPLLPSQSPSDEATIAATPSPNEEQRASEELAGSVSDITDSARPTSSTRTVRSSRPAETHVRKQSIADSVNAEIVRTLVDSSLSSQGIATTDTSALPTGAAEAFAAPDLRGITAMLHRKIWVKRPGASATLVQIKEDDLVDDVRDLILRKYANSLGKTFDSPDMTLNIVTRSQHGEQRMERLLGPDEDVCRTIDSYYPGGQTVDEALVINVPQRRTPRSSPRVMQPVQYHTMDEYRPMENGTDYFPPMPAIIQPTIPQTSSSEHSRVSHNHPQGSVAVPIAEHPRSISVLNTGQIAPLPSPGGRSSRHHSHRPKVQRQATSSPTIVSHAPNAGAVAVNGPVGLPQSHLVHRQTGRPRHDSSASEAHRVNGIPAPPPLPTPPAPEMAPTAQHPSNPPTPSAGGLPARPATRPRKSRRSTPDQNGKPKHGREGSVSSPAGVPNISSMLDGSVPPINVLIVEDNIINLRILEGLMKRLKVRWQTAMNGQIAVDKWKAGGFHLVLMDIQMPIMNGLQATKEIRRLERVNGIGVFSSSAATSPQNPNGISEDDKPKDRNPEDDKLPISNALFKSPIIIVALTASSLQSDRHEALAAGCNDFLTKPVNFVWLERKVKEWGCMQALIDFDGWRKWKDFAKKAEEGKSEEEKKRDREKDEKEKVKAEKMAKLQEKQAARKAEVEREREKEKQRESARRKGASLQGGSNGDVGETIEE